METKNEKLKFQNDKQTEEIMLIKENLSIDK